MMPATIGAREENTHVVTAQPAVKLTHEDYCAAPADKRYELLDGELIMVPAPDLKHQTAQLELATQLNQVIKDKALGTLLTAPLRRDAVRDECRTARSAVRLAGTEAPAARRPESAGRTRPRGRDPVSIKRQAEPREEAGTLREALTEYWLVDPVAETVQVYRQQGEVLLPTHTVGREQTLRSPLLTGLELQIDDSSRPDAHRRYERPSEPAPPRSTPRGRATNGKVATRTNTARKQLAMTEFRRFDLRVDNGPRRAPRKHGTTRFRLYESRTTDPERPQRGEPHDHETEHA